MERDPIEHEEATERVANLLHAVIHHLRNAQLFHRLRIGVRSLETFSEVIALAGRELSREITKKENQKLKQLRYPSSDDIKQAQMFFIKYERKYIPALLARAVGFCPVCREELKEGE